MESPLSLQEMRTKAMDECRTTGDTTFQGYLDGWLNEEVGNIVSAYDFPELYTEWYATLSTTAPTPNVWTPYELTAVPRDMVKIMRAWIIDTTNTSSQPKQELEVIPAWEFDRMRTVVNPPTSGKPAKCCLRRIEGAQEHGLAPRTGTAGIRVTSTATEDTTPVTLFAGVQYYNDADRKDIRKTQSSTAISATPTALITGTHYGIKAASLNKNSSGLITIDNTAGTIVFAVINPWERAASYKVIGFDVLPDLTTYNCYFLYKRSIEYLSQASDTMSPLPPLAQALALNRAIARGHKFKGNNNWQALELTCQKQEREMVHVHRTGTMDEPRVELY